MFANIVVFVMTAVGGCIANDERSVGKQDIIIVNDIQSITDSKNAVIYCRLSTSQEMMGAPEYACSAYCDEKGYTVVDVVKEVGSAFKAKQPKLKKLIKQSKDVNLIIYKLDRFSRNVGQCDAILKTMLANKINLECITDPVNLSSSLGKLKFRESIAKA